MATNRLRKRRRRPASRPKDNSNSSTTMDQDNNNSHNASSLASSFLAIPDAVLTGTGLLAPALRLLPRQRSTTTAAWVHSLLKRPCLLGTDDDHTPPAKTAHALLLAAVAPLPTDNDTSLVPAIWTLLQDIFTNSNHPSLLLLSAIVANHARRVFFVLDNNGPLAAWLGAAMVRPRPPDAAWSLVRVRPDVFLAGAVGHHSPLVYVLDSLQKRAWDGAAAAGMLLAEKQAGSSPFVHFLAATVFLVWVCSCVEYAVERVGHAVAWGVAGGRMLHEWWRFGQSPTLTAVATAEVSWSSLVVAGMVHVGFHGVYAVVPLLRAAVQRATTLRQPGLLLMLLLAAIGVHLLVRHRSRVYLATEASGVFVCGGYAAAGALLMVLRRRQRELL